MAPLLILFIYSSVVLVMPLSLSNDVNLLIRTLQRKYCGGLFCTVDSSYVPPVCPESTTLPVIENSSLSNPGLSIENVTLADQNLTSHISRCDPCSECSCDDSCQFFGNCCADINIGGKYFINCEMIEKYTDDGTERDQYMIVTKCLPDAPYYSQDLAWKCQHGKIGHIQDGRPVTAPHPFNTSVTFRNKYCAICYNITNYVAWKVYLSCDEEFDSSNSSDINSLIRSVQLTNICTVSFELTHGPMPSYCFQHNKFISSCNVTGKWQEYNKSIETACESYFNPTRDWKYRNIFCYLCNGETHDELICPSNCMMGYYKPIVVRPFTALLNFENSDAKILKSENSNYQILRIGKQEAHQCREDDVYDKQSKICREVYCPLGGKTTNVSCVRLVPSQQYTLTMWDVTAYYSDEVIIPFPVDSPPIGKTVIEALNRFLEEFGFFIYSGKYSDLASINTPKSLLIRESELHLSLFLLPGFSLKSTREKLYQNLTLDISWHGEEFDVKVVEEYKNITDKLLMVSGTYIPLHKDIIKNDWRNIIEVPLAFNLSCPMVRFANYDVETAIDSVIIHDFNTLTEEEYFTTKTGEYLICVGAFLRENGIYKPVNIAKSADALTERIFTGVCLSCSLLLLLVTMFVYIFISELHTVPGLNLIFLTSSMFVAQCFYLFGAGTVSTPTICTVIGVFIHYFWLVAFAWMNVCCLHMFKVFTNTFSYIHLENYKLPLMLKYSSFTYGAAALVVISTLVTTYILSGYKSVAYGGTNLCFIAPGLVSIISFGIPAGVTVVVNAVLLIITTVNLRRANTVRRHLGRTEANDISKFFKLSTITGLSWIFGFLGYLLHRVELLYTFTLLTAGQGVFIFLSFVASRRILKMVRDKLGCPQIDRFNHNKQNCDSSSNIQMLTQDTYL